MLAPLLWIVVSTGKSPRHVAYAELHCHSSFSFLDGASHPEELVAMAKELDLEAIALTDHDGLYGVVRFFEAARELSVPVVYGAELTLAPDAAVPGAAVPGARKAPSRTRAPDPEGSHLVALARSATGYTRLARAL
ncbi:MAG: PHP domain-containing protein, partial [Acidimicrobiales bacterium]